MQSRGRDHQFPPKSKPSISVPRSRYSRVIMGNEVSNYATRDGTDARFLAFPLTSVYLSLPPVSHLYSDPPGRVILPGSGNAPPQARFAASRLSKPGSTKLKSGRGVRLLQASSFDMTRQLKIMIKISSNSIMNEKDSHSSVS